MLPSAQGPVSPPSLEGRGSLFLGLGGGPTSLAQGLDREAVGQLCVFRGSSPPGPLASTELGKGRLGARWIPCPPAGLLTCWSVFMREAPASTM